MKLRTQIWMAVVLGGLIAHQARADQPLTIFFDTNSPTSPAAGKVSGSGGYTRPANGTVSSIILYALVKTGGPGGSIACMYNDTNKTWSGTITGLAANTYKVFAVITLTNGSTASTEFVDVTVQ